MSCHGGRYPGTSDLNSTPSCHGSMRTTTLFLTNALSRQLCVSLGQQRKTNVLSWRKISRYIRSELNTFMSRLDANDHVVFDERIEQAVVRVVGATEEDKCLVMAEDIPVHQI